MGFNNRVLDCLSLFINVVFMSEHSTSLDTMMHDALHVENMYMTDFIIIIIFNNWH